MIALKNILIDSSKITVYSKKNMSPTKWKNIRAAVSGTKNIVRFSKNSEYILLVSKDLIILL